MVDVEAEEIIDKLPYVPPKVKAEKTWCYSLYLAEAEAELLANT